MEFDTSKNKIQTIGNKQNSIDSSLSNKNNELKNKKNSPTVLKTSTILFESDYQPFQTNRHFGGLISIPIQMPISANSVNFSGNISIPEELIPYIRHNIIVKKPTLGEVNGLYVANISTYDSVPITQVGLFEEHTDIYNQDNDLIGNTGSGEGTIPKPDGDALVTKTVHALFTTDGQRSIYSQDMTSSLILEKIENNIYKFSIASQVQFLFDVDELENVGVSNLEGEMVYVATFVPSEPTNVSYYTLTDNRVSVSYPAYRPIEFDIEAKLILSIPPNNIWEDYSKYNL